MRPRFVLDESSWDGAANAAEPGELSDAIERLLERLEVVRDRREGVAAHDCFFDTDIGGDFRFEHLFDQNCPVLRDHGLDRDAVNQLMEFFTKAGDVDDSILTDYSAEFEGEVRFTPGVAWAHTSCRAGQHRAVLPLPLGDAPKGTVPVTVDDTPLDVFFVTDESHHVDFFRAVITLENANRAKFESLAPSAFPMLDWADNVWRGLGDFSRPYIEVREELVQYLGGLNDHGAACFYEFQPNPGELAGQLSARIGARTSDEAGHTRGHAESRADRTRPHGGTDKVFWWHVKLRPYIDRIYFLYESPPTDSTEFPKGRIVVGIFKDHCT